MKTYILLSTVVVTLLALFSSCATILNKQTTDVHIHDPRKSFAISYKDSVYQSQPYDSKWTAHTNMVKLQPERRKEPLIFTVLEDTTTILKYKPTIDNRILLNIATYGLGFIVDLNSNKRYTYPQYIDLQYPRSSSDKELAAYMSRKEEKPIDRKGRVNLEIGMPFLNFMQSTPDFYGKHRNDFAVFGISLGADYYYNHNRYFNLTTAITGIANGNFYGCGFDEERLTHQIQTFYNNITHNHRLWRFLSLGYGVSYGINWWRRTESTGSRYEENGGYSHSETVEKRHVLGLAFNAYIMPTESFYFGVNYRPTFMRFQKQNRFEYEHLISVSFGFKIRLKKPKRVKMEGWDNFYGY